MSNQSDPAAMGEIVAGLQTFAARVIVHRLLAAEALDLAPTDLGAMCLLQLHGAETPGWLAERIGLSTGAVTGMLDRLERTGYITRAQDRNDRRRVIVEPDLQRFARDVARQAPTRAPLSLSFLQDYSPSQLRTIRRFVAHLAEASRGE